MRNKQVVVIGGSQDTENHDTAYRIGEHIARKGYTLITGGRGGIMESASRGAYESGGTVIGILPSAGLDDANRYCTVVIPTGIGYARNVINVLCADIIIAVGGKAGTLTELAYAWNYKKPIIACTFIKGWSSSLPEQGIDDREGGRVFRAGSIQEVFSLLDGFFRSE